jgi:4-hydroxy-2-oxoglutarate aldolase
MFYGIYTPVLTPFAADQSIDYQKMAHNLNKWAETDLSGIVVLGSNGEFVYLSEEEKLEVVAFCINHFPKDKKIIVGTSCESTGETILFSRRVAEMGADAVLVLPPHYYQSGMTDTVLEQYFTEVADACPVPVMLYNMPANTGLNLSSSLVSRLSRHPNITGIKDTSGNIVQLAEIIRDTHPEFAVFAGNAGYLLPALVLGAKGATLALANILPEDCCRLMDDVNRGRMEEARLLQLRMLAINQLVTRGIGVPALKAAADMLGYQGGIPRKPLLPLDEKNRILVENTLRAYQAGSSKS